MKRLKLIILALAVISLTMIAGASYFRGNWAFTTAFSLDASVTKTNGAEFTSLELSVKDTPSALLTVTFTRAAGSTSKVAFYFQVSYDNGTTWADFVDPVSSLEYIEVATNHSVISGTTVRVSNVVMPQGASHIRLSKVVNNDTANNLTAVNASLSF